MVFFGERTPRFFHRLEIGIAIELEYLQRAQFIGAARSVTRATPAIMGCLSKPARIALVVMGALFALFLGQAFELIIVAIIFAGMLGAERPTLGTVWRLWRRTVSGLFASMAIAQAHLDRIARRFITAPAGKSPVIGSTCTSHKSLF